MKNMKAKIFSSKSVILCSMLLFIGFSACKDAVETQANAEVDDATVETDASAEEMYEDVDIISNEGMQLATAQGGRYLSEDEFSLTKCAKINHDKENKKVTVDFGEGCEGPQGRVRKGRIIIEYTDYRFVPGATTTITFEEYYVEGNKIEGIRTIQNISTQEGNPTFEITLTDGKITFEDGTYITREVAHIREWVRTNTPADDEYRLTGSTSGVNRRGTAYTADIESALVFKRACRADGIFIPVQGIKKITRGNRSASIDYGSGDCDKDITITRNGVERVVQFKKWRN